MSRHDPPPTIHQVSIEHLFHYRCGACDQWWTVADKFVEVATCPSCGKRAAAFKAPPSLPQIPD